MSETETKTTPKRQRAKRQTRALARRGPDKVVSRGAHRRRAAVVTGKLQGLVGSMTRDMFSFLDLSAEVIRDKLYVPLHYQGPEEYFGQRIGYSYRSLKRRLVIMEALNRLGEGKERAEGRRALSSLGIHRAAILAPIIGKAGHEWREWITRARRLDEDALAEAVNKALGGKVRAVRGHTREGAVVRSTSEKWLDDTLLLLPEEMRDEIKNVFEAGRVVLQTDSHFAVLRMLVAEQSVEWQRDARARGWAPAGETAAAAGEAETEAVPA